MTQTVDPATAPVPFRQTPAPDEAVPIMDEVRTALMVARRELIRFARGRARVLTSLAQPLIFLFILGYGLSPLIGSTGGFDFKKFMLPGVIAMSVVTSAIFGGMSIVWDREFGFLREMLVAPPSRVSLVVGKTIGGAVVASGQGLVLLVLAPAVGVHLTPLLVVQIIGVAVLMAVALTALGVLVASRVQRIEGFQVVTQLLLMPMIFLSGAMFPLNGLPGWLRVVTSINPLSYAIDPLRHLVLSAQDLPPEAHQRFASRIDLFGHQLSTGTELAIVAGFALMFLSLAVRGFGKPD